MKKALFEKLSGFAEDREVIYAEDYDFWLRLTKHGCNIEILPEFLGEFRITGKNFGNNVDRQLLSMINIVIKHYSLLEKKTIYTNIMFKRKIADIYMSLAWASFRANTKLRSIVYLRWQRRQLLNVHNSTPASFPPCRLVILLNTTWYKKKRQVFTHIFKGLSVWPFHIKSYASIILFLLNKDFKRKNK